MQPLAFGAIGPKVERTRARQVDLDGLAKLQDTAVVYFNLDIGLTIRCHRNAAVRYHPTNHVFTHIPPAMKIGLAEIIDIEVVRILAVWYWNQNSGSCVRAELFV